MISTKRAFTLIELLVIVVVLGVLAAVVVARYGSVTEEAKVNSTYFELEKTRRALDVFVARNENAMPAIVTGNGDAAWGALVDREYMKMAPTNSYVDPANAKKVLAGGGVTAQVAYSADYGWIVNTTSGKIWAGGFDASDEPLPKP